MNMELPKNRIGVGGSFGRSGTSKTTASKNLRKASIGHSYSLSQSMKPKRSTYTHGVSTLGMTSKYSNYSNLRFSLNAGANSWQRQRTLGSTTTSYGSSYSTYSPYSGSNATQVFGYINQTFAGLASLGGAVAGIVEARRGATNSETVDNALQSLGSGGGSVSSMVSSSDTSGCIANMMGCNDSSSLRAAIVNAQDQLSQLNSQTQDLQTASDKATNNLSEFKTAKANAEKLVKEKEQSLKNAQNSVKAKTELRDSKQLALEKADQNYGNAVKQHTAAKEATQQAQMSLNSATTAEAQAKQAYESALSSLPPQTIDGKPNPAYAAAKAKVDELKAAWDKAKTEKTNAEKALEQAKKAEQEAEQAMNAAHEQLGAAQKEADEAKEALDKAQEELDKAKEAQSKAQDELKAAQDKLSEAEDNVSSAEGAIEQFKAHQQDVETLTKTIESQTKRLTTIENKEKEEFTKMGNKIDDGVEANTKRDQHINTDDGTSVRERIKMRKMEKTNMKMETYLERRNAVADNVAKTNILHSGIPEGHVDYNGNSETELRSGTLPSGTKVYFVGSKEIPETEYRQLLDQSKNPPTA